MNEQVQCYLCRDIASLIADLLDLDESFQQKAERYIDIYGLDYFFNNLELFNFSPEIITKLNDLKFIIMGYNLFKKNQLAGGDDE